MGTFFQSKEQALSARKWRIVDATGISLGRLASEVAMLIRGKNNPTFTRHVDGGDFVVVVNADKIRLTGKKLDNKVYQSHSGYPGGFKQISARDLLCKHPEKLVTEAVKGMLPRGPLGHQMMTKLKVYKGDTHPHRSQTPEVYNLKYVKREQ